MSIVTRFAPSPTGHLHVGNIRIALINWLFARQKKGTFILRVDDTDRDRSTAAFDHQIQFDLEWLGLDHDVLRRQSERMPLYEKAMERLKMNARLYPCYETPEELSLKRKIQLGKGQPPRYDRSALKLTMSERKAYEDEGRKPHWRFLLTDEVVEWNDLVHGPVRFEPGHLSDPVLIREDGYILYTLSSVVDDLDMGVSHIFRGDDHITNTAVQRQLMKALGADPNRIALGHVPLVMSGEGEGLSKRTGGLSIKSLREDGIDPMAINSLLCHLGTSQAITPEENLEGLMIRFDVSTITSTSPKFSVEELEILNRKILHKRSFSDIQPALKAFGLEGKVDAAFWDLIRENVGTFKDLNFWWDVCQGDLSEKIEFSTEDLAYLKEALACLPTEEWTAETWGEWTGCLKEKTGRKGKHLFMPLRQVLTGQSKGPEMKNLLPLMGPEKVKKRFQAVLEPMK